MGSCVIHETGVGCAVFDARPRECRTWSLWPGMIVVSSAREAAAAGCPGIGSGEHFSRERIAAHARHAVRRPRDGER